MKSGKLNNILTDLGLSENEAQVYLASLSLGASGITAIARAANIKRTTAYSVIESLRQQGLIGLELQGLKNVYVPESPKKLKAILEERKNKLEDLLPEFEALHNLKGSGSLVKYYEGFESVKSAYESLIADVKPGDDYLVMSNIDTWYNLDPKYLQGFIERRAKLPIKVRMILQDTPFAHNHQKIGPNYNMTVRFFPKKVSLKLNIVITPQKIVFHQLVPPIRCLVIENKFLIEFQQQVFNLLWETLP